MITGALKSRIDKLWTEFWTGGITNPLTVIEQISFLMFARMLDLIERRNDLKSLRGLATKPLFSPEQQHLRWSNFRQLSGAEMLPLVRDQVFPHFKGLSSNGNSLGRFMVDAQLLIQKPSLLVSAVGMIEELPLEQGDQKGDLYEYLLSKLTTAGINGQFRTPRHIIRMMVELLDPEPSEIIADPACGTAGFLVGALQYIYEQHTSEAGVIESEDAEGKAVRYFTGDLLSPSQRENLANTFHGFDFDITMLRIGAMNLMLHGIDNPDVVYQDTLGESFDAKRSPWAADSVDVILANPPFKGSLDVDDIHPWLRRQLKTTKTELLFVALMLRMLKPGGRCATIVPDGVLFGSSTAHRELRRKLVDEHQLEGVISLPSGVFKPYAGVSTAVLVFTKAGQTGDVFFYDVQADGFTLDDKRLRTPQPGDLPDLIAQWQRWKAGDNDQPTDRTAKCFAVPAGEIRDQGYDLSLNRYKDVAYEEPKYDPPKVLISRLRQLENAILIGLDDLEGLLR